MATSFCAVSDIQRYLQTPVDGSSTPTSAQAQSFADERAAVLISLCGMHGLTVDPNTFVSTTPIGRMLVAANAIGAALDFTLAQVFGQTPTQTDRIPALSTLWRQYTGLWDGNSPSWITGQGYIPMLLDGTLVGSLAVDHITSGVESEDGNFPTVHYDEEF